jgi:DNA-binding transcriptional regulator YiaG
MEAVHPLKAYRETNNLKPADLARLLGVSRATVHRWETGERKPSRDKLPVIKEKTGIGPGAILEYEAAQ